MYVFNGDMGRRHIQVSADRTIADSDTGFSVFMDIQTSGGGARNLFDTVDQIADALEAGSAPGTLLDDLDLAMQNVLGTRASAGARLNAVEEQELLNESFILSMEANRSKVQDLDYAEALTRFSQQETALQAAQQVFLRLEGLSLFNLMR
ncbi:MAG: hypothetical protein B0D96_13345 [Candidatus Sedimenticola endophacoides]|uniref:Flagellin C-terminal domain-containing protein n=1 Tax=Candidatus Sedimenticola endophacoides TaxID=2548426 RepID=A0A657Q4D4_9GAMM|nr:MAG: hypothetical protein B0D94_03990 [Candidatus Sedimenticola endophacoides]OQX32634.1 MAG: hypothetical protein B0D96_13345 [Candidatus Sedimenticola endophacoides]OQX37605.1 MAG: hypothetical protein B0D84_00485 [Candidatus Sedimenticola endophacoides]OQX42853.1 MAG: hypothetical protein B0D89_00420 [Candidatus Sedimenticola endophacoides]OQX47485.1 MAG: hypothetical protein B0D87_09435 [Candidatus Sedimenticola endophacoides]